MDEPAPPHRLLPPGRPDFLPPALPGPPPWTDTAAPAPQSERPSRTWAAVLAVTVVLAVLAAGVAAAVLAVVGRPDSSTALPSPTASAPAFGFPLLGPSTGPSAGPSTGLTTGPSRPPAPTSASPVPRPVFVPPVDQQPLPDGKPSVADGAAVGAVARATLPGVVQLVSTARSAAGSTAGSATGDSSGSGFVVRNSGGGSGPVVTNNHVVADVVAGRADLGVVFTDGTRTRRPGRRDEPVLRHGRRRGVRGARPGAGAAGQVGTGRGR